MTFNDQELNAALDELHELAQRTRDEFRRVLSLTDKLSMTMTYAQLFAADEVLGKISRLAPKPAKEPRRDR